MIFLALITYFYLLRKAQRTLIKLDDFVIV